MVEGPKEAGFEQLTVAAITEHPFGTIEFSGDRWALDDVRLLAPILPSKVVAVGKNYEDHAKETGAAIPKEPILFNKLTNCIVGPTDNVMVPKNSTKLDYEVEIAFVIGTEVYDHLEQVVDRFEDVGPIDGAFGMSLTSDPSPWEDI